MQTIKEFKVGFGYDIHRLKKGTNITLGGVNFSSKKSIVAHSDGDIVLHALSNAILQCLGLEDIGFFFDDKKEETKNISSKEILSLCLSKLKEHGFFINNVGITIITKEPRITPLREQLLNSLKKLLNINISNISIHSGTKESLGDVGKGKAIECYAIVSIIK